LVKLCEDALVICSTLLFFSKICVIHSFRAYRQSRIPTGIFICFEFIFLMSHIFVGDGVHPFGSPLIFFNHNDLKREPNRKRKKPLKSREIVDIHSDLYRRVFRAGWCVCGVVLCRTSYGKVFQ
jgi:hypothetical protein